jgi:RNA recognition motif-containing protein
MGRYLKQPMGIDDHSFPHGYPFSPETQPIPDKQSKEMNKILIVSNLPIGITPDVIFRLFSLYGNVQKVKIMFKKRDTALVEFQDYL